MALTPLLTRTRAAAAVATFGLVVGGGGVALAQDQTTTTTRTQHGHHGQHGQAAARGSHGGYQHGGKPTDIPNLTLVKNKIKLYYGDDGTTDSNATRDSRYARDVRRVEKKAGHALPRLVRRADAKPAVVVDVDDTTLLTYRYEATHDFGYDPVANAAYIHDPGMPKVFGMPRLLQRAAHRTSVYYLTGRPETQRADTERDLRAAGYPDVSDSHLFMRNKTTPPSYLACEPTCTTIQYKSLTRRHIETLAGGQDIVLNMGDQFSDLKGGYADKRLKLPNPMYYLP